MENERKIRTEMKDVVGNLFNAMKGGIK